MAKFEGIARRVGAIALALASVIVAAIVVAGVFAAYNALTRRLRGDAGGDGTSGLSTDDIQRRNSEARKALEEAILRLRNAARR